MGEAAARPDGPTTDRFKHVRRPLETGTLTWAITSIGMRSLFMTLR